MIESAIVFIPHRVVTGTATLCDFPQRQAFKDDLFDDALLRLWKRGERFLNDLLQFLSGGPRRRFRGCFPGHGFFKIGPAVELSQRKIVPAIDAPVISEL